jgi:uncharacterized protein (TIGR03435 family)
MMRAGVAAIVVALLGVSIAAQQPKPRFEVASVKPQHDPTMRIGPDGPTFMVRFRPGGVFNPTHATVENLLIFAYDLKPNRYTGGPAWTREERFEITATAGFDAPADQIRLMVQSLLEDRFKLVAHVEPREMRYQALVRARPDGPLGPGLVTMDRCDAATVIELRRTRPDKYPPPMGNGMISSCAPSGVSTLAEMIALGLETPVVDETGLQGSFYFSLRSDFRIFPVPASLGASKTDPNLPALSTALAEQLGLRLESRRGPVDVLVIDSVQQPTEN